MCAECVCVCVWIWKNIFWKCIFAWQQKARKDRYMFMSGVNRKRSGTNIVLSIRIWIWIYVRHTGTRYAEENIKVIYTNVEGFSFSRLVIRFWLVPSFRLFAVLNLKRNKNKSFSANMNNTLTSNHYGNTIPRLRLHIFKWHITLRTVYNQLYSCASYGSSEFSSFFTRVQGDVFFCFYSHKMI